MDQTTPQQSLLNMLSLDGDNKSNLAEAARWAKFLGILHLIGLALIILLGGGIALFAGSLMGDVMPGIGAVGVGLLYVVIGLVALYPTWSLYKFGQLTRQGVQMEDQMLFSQGIVHLKKFFKFVGIFSLVAIGLYVLVIIVALITGAFMNA